MPQGINSSMAVQVLIVDDERIIRDMLSRWLTREGFGCIQAGGVAEAISLLSTHDPQVMTCDINMPGGSGLELLKHVQTRQTDMQVLMLTGQGETRLAVDALTHGAYGYLLKPVEREELVIQVQRGLERRQLLFERRQYTLGLERRVAEQTAALRLAHEETIHRLVGATMHRDEETGAHIRRTGLFSEVLARVAGWSVTEAERIRMAAPMHDVGKIAIPDAVLQKPGKLTAAEYEVMKRHAEIGAQMLAGSSSPILQMAEQIALRHHERWDGRGYPHGIAGEAIPEAARIVSIVDVYDALSHDRVYRPAMPPSEVLRLMQEGSGSQFDPGLLALFLTVQDDIDQIAIDNPDRPVTSAIEAATVAPDLFHHTAL